MIIIQIKPLLILFSDLHVEGNLAVKVGQVIVHISVLSHLFWNWQKEVNKVIDVQAEVFLTGLSSHKS